MKAHELARRLLKGEDLPVTRRGYEGGVHEIETILPPEPIHMNVNGKGYYGPHEYHGVDYCGRCEDLDEEIPAERAIHLS